MFEKLRHEMAVSGREEKRNDAFLTFTLSMIVDHM